MKTAKVLYIELTPSDPAYAAVARRYNRHVERQNRRARWYGFWKDLISKEK